MVIKIMILIVVCAGLVFAILKIRRLLSKHDLTKSNYVRNAKTNDFDENSAKQLLIEIEKKILISYTLYHINDILIVVDSQKLRKLLSEKYPFNREPVIDWNQELNHLHISEIELVRESAIKLLKQSSSYAKDSDWRSLFRKYLSTIARENAKKILIKEASNYDIRIVEDLNKL